MMVLYDLFGKTIESIGTDEHKQTMVVRFTDGTLWVLHARRWNCSGSRIESNVIEPGYWEVTPKKIIPNGIPGETPSASLFSGETDQFSRKQTEEHL